MGKARNPLHVFLVGTVVLLPVTFFVWYVTAPYHLVMVAGPVEQLCHWLMPGAVRRVGLDGNLLHVVTHFVPGPGGQLVPDPGAVLTASFKLNPLILGYGVPLYVAMALAVPGKGKLARLVFGLALLLPVHILCVVLDIASHLTQLGGQVFLQMVGMGVVGFNLLSLGRKFAVLIIPGVAPLIAWVALHRGFLTRLAPQFVFQKLARQEH